MRNIVVRSLCSAIVLSLGVFLAGTGAAMASSYPDGFLYYCYPLVDTDTRTSTAGKSTYVNGSKDINGTTVMRYHRSDNSEDYLAFAGTGLMMYGSAGYQNGSWTELLFDSPMFVSDYDLYIGHTDTGSTTFNCFGLTMNAASSFKVEGREDVTIGTGVFFRNALKVTWTITTTCSAIGFSTTEYETLWLYHDFGVLKSYDSTTGETEISQTIVTHYPSLLKKAELFSAADPDGYIGYVYQDEDFDGRGYGRISAKRKADGSISVFYYWDNTENKSKVANYNASGSLMGLYFYYESGQLKSVTYPAADADGNYYYEYYEGSGNLHVKTNSGNFTFIYREDGTLEKILGNAVRLTNDTCNDCYPAINDQGLIVWENEYETFDKVFLYNGAGVLTVSEGTHSLEEPVINDRGHIVCLDWTKHVYGDISYYNGSSIVYITDDIYRDYNYDMNDNGCVVWQKNPGYDETNSEIYFYDGSTVSQITSNTLSDINPKINNVGDIVWISSGDVMLYRDQTATNISDNAVSGVTNHNLDVNDNRDIVWCSDDGSICRLNLYHNGTVNVIAEMYHIDSVKVNAKGQIAWVGSITASDDNEIFLYDGTKVIQLSDNYEYDLSPQINDLGVVVWAGYDRYDFEIFRYDSGVVDQLTYNICDDEYPSINNRGEIAWQRDDGNDTEIYLLSQSKSCAPMLATDMNGNGKREFIVNFGPYFGSWIYFDDGSWKQLHSASPCFMVSGNVDGDTEGKEDLVIDFGPLQGVWAYYNDAYWQKLNSAAARSMVTADIDNNGMDDVVVDFGPCYGVWAFMNNSSWSFIHAVSPGSMMRGNIDFDPVDDIVFDFGLEHGVWILFNGVNWFQLHTVNAESVAIGDINGSGIDDVVIDFGSDNGIWIYYDNGNWSKLHNVSPDFMCMGNIDNDTKKDIVIDFGQYGVWAFMNNSAWSFIHGTDPDSVSLGDMSGNGQDDIVLDFGIESGIWKYGNAGWSKLHSVSPMGTEA